MKNEPPHAFNGGPDDVWPIPDKLMWVDGGLFRGEFLMAVRRPGRSSWHIGPRDRPVEEPPPDLRRTPMRIIVLRGENGALGEACVGFDPVERVLGISASAVVRSGR